MIGALIVFAVSYAFIATEKMNRTVAALLGAAAVIFLGFIPHEVALEKIDLNVFFLLVGMMIIVETLSQTGIFEWIAVVIAQRARGNGMIILLGLAAATGILSAFLDNVTTVVLIVPITILITQILEIPVIPFLIIEALFSNIGGTATLIGDPPNIIIGSKSHLTFNQFLLNLGPVVLLDMLILLALVYVVFRRKMQVAPEARQRIMLAQPHRAITDAFRLKRALPMFGLTLLGFGFGHLIGVEPGVIALTGALLTVLVSRGNLVRAFQKVEWETIFFLFGLFILVGALEHNHLFDLLGKGLFNVTQGHVLLACLAVLWLSGALAAVLGAVPVAIAMIPLVNCLIPAFAAQLASNASPAVQAGEPLWWALALGACLGGNGTLLGTPASVVVAQIAKKNQYDISFMGFARYGLPVTVLSLFLCSGYIYVRYFLAPGW